MILCIDTITEFSGITVVDHKKCYAYLPLKTEHRAEQILPTIDRALKKAHIKLSDLMGVLVIKGPGSFTSLRVALAVGNQFAHQLKIPIVGLRTDEWWAYRTEERPVVYLQSMNREEVYVGGISAPGIENVYKVYTMYRMYTFLGQLSEEHRVNLPPDFREVHNLKSPEDTWVAAAQTMSRKPVAHKLYDLVEPFYGKEPTITKSAKIKND